MITAKCERKNQGYLVQLIGAVDDDANLEQAIGALPAPPFELHVHCGQINRINSVGVKGWIKYFQGIQARQIPLFFWDCSPPIVQQMNLVFNFLCGGKPVSVQASFSCESCDHIFLQTLQVAALYQSGFEVPDQKCPKCAAAASFDDLPKMYFKFLMAPPAR